MGGVGFSELLVIGIVALIVLNPKDLPGLLRTLGRTRARIGHLRAQFVQEMDSLERSIDPGHNLGTPKALLQEQTPPPHAAAPTPSKEPMDGIPHGTRTDP